MTPPDRSRRSLRLPDPDERPWPGLLSFAWFRLSAGGWPGPAAFTEPACSAAKPVAPATRYGASHVCRCVFTIIVVPPRWFMRKMPAGRPQFRIGPLMPDSLRLVLPTRLIAAFHEL
jgi:hypothetical protein